MVGVEGPAGALYGTALCYPKHPMSVTSRAKANNIPRPPNTCV